MNCVEIREGCKAADGKQPFGFNWAVFFARHRRPNHPYAALVAARPPDTDSQTGFEYVSNGGVTSAKDPITYPRSVTVGRNTVVDGSLTWTARAISFDSLVERIDTVTWDVNSAPLTLTDELIIDEAGYQGTLATIEGGVKGRTYDIRVHVVTTLANHYDAILRLTIV